MAKLYTGIRLIFNTGGTKTKLAISNNGSSVGNPIIFKTNQELDLWLSDIKEKTQEIVGENKISVVCGGIAGVFDQKKTKLLRSPNLVEWQNRPLKKKLEEIFEVPVFLENDVALEGLGEATIGVGRRSRLVAYVAIGTGIGGVRIENGKISENAFGFEPGHQIIDLDGEVGYWEDFASGTAMKNTYGKSPEEISDPEIWKRETRLISIGIHNLIVTWSPEMLIIGGSVIKGIDFPILVKMIEEQMQRFPKIPKIVVGELTEKAGLYGALEYLRSL